MPHDSGGRALSRVQSRLGHQGGGAAFAVVVTVQVNASKRPWEWHLRVLR
jgi:hypothetical protein